MEISEGGLRDIHWWLDSVRYSGRAIIQSGPKEVIYTDASNEGWGAHIEERTAGGRWSSLESEDHINVLELKELFCSACKVYVSALTRTSG